MQFNLGEKDADVRRLYRSRDPGSTPLLVRHADELAEVGGDDEFEVGLAALLAGFRHLVGTAG